VKDRTELLRSFEHLLSTPAGEDLVAELAETWDVHKLIGATPEITAYNVGLRDAYKFITMLQTGELIHDD